MDELREEIEREQSGFVTGLINWLSAAATSTASGFDLRAAYRRLLALRPGLGRSMDDEHDSDILARLEVRRQRSCFSGHSAAMNIRNRRIPGCAASAPPAHQGSLITPREYPPAGSGLSLLW